MIKILRLLIVIIFGSSCLAFSWDGYNYTTGNYIEVDEYDHRGTGEGEVEYYDYGSGEYRQGYLDMEPGGTGTLYDYETGDRYDVDMN